MLKTEFAAELVPLIRRNFFSLVHVGCSSDRSFPWGKIVPTTFGSSFHRKSPTNSWREKWQEELGAGQLFDPHHSLKLTIPREMDINPAMGLRRETPPGKREAAPMNGM